MITRAFSPSPTLLSRQKYRRYNLTTQPTVLLPTPPLQSLFLPSSSRARYLDHIPKISIKHQVVVIVPRCLRPHPTYQRPIGIMCLAWLCPPTDTWNFCSRRMTVSGWGTWAHEVKRGGVIKVPGQPSNNFNGYCGGE